MTIPAINRLEARTLLSHTALCITLAGGLGFIAAGLASLDLQGFVTLSKIAHFAIAIVCISACFAILWCSADGPDRWRPVVVSPEAAESIFGAAAIIILLGGIVAVTAFYLE
jgi:hypothetical protein